ncbi:MAG: lipoyl(octanoyl) transferase LipB [Gammaproteobacteria bacterium]|nr:lipoyl(octanoyl) transferase LipB [Gammaproteobacteria bacterium]
MIIVRSLGREDYEPLWRRMQSFTDTRDESIPDEIWFTEHPPVFTLGLNASREHLLDTGDIPVVQVDRGGQVTYHGPGQLMIYPLIDLKRAKIGVRHLVTGLEQSIVDLVADYGIEGKARKDAPGVYVDGQKIASVGLRIRRGASFHGMALNIDMDLAPFSQINPCGFNDLAVTDLLSLGISADRESLRAAVERNLLGHLGLRNEEIVRPD